jgi:methyltransferase (TIGR00027 family)
MTTPSEIFDGPAITALGLAVSRSVESNRPDRLIDDPLARAFVTAAHINLPMRLDWPQRDEAVTATERLHLHGSRYIGLRTRFYDDLLISAAGTGIRQSVLIGAGLDTRAVRLALPATFHLLELDQSRLLAWKQEVLDAQLAIPRCRRSWIGTDLREDWPSELMRRGFDPGQPAAFIAEGLLPYLSPRERFRLVSQIDALAAPGSVLALDRIVGDPHAHGRVSRLSRDSGLDMTTLMASGENDDTAARMQADGWKIRETAVAHVAASYGRDLGDPFHVSRNASEPEPPWLETRFLQATR